MQSKEQLDDPQDFKRLEKLDEQIQPLPLEIIDNMSDKEILDFE